MWEKNVSNLWRTFTIFLFLVLPPTLVGGKSIPRQKEEEPLGRPGFTRLTPSELRQLGFHTEDEYEQWLRQQDGEDPLLSSMRISPPENMDQQVVPPENIEHVVPPENMEQIAPPENMDQQVVPPENIEHVVPPENMEQIAPPENMDQQVVLLENQISQPARVIENLEQIELSPHSSLPNVNERPLALTQKELDSVGMTENDWDLTGTVSPLQLDHPPFLKPHSLQLTPKEFASLGLTSGSGVEETPIAHEPARTPPPAELQALRIPHRDSLEMPSDQIAKMGNRSEGEPETPRPPQISTNPLVQDPYVEDRGAFGEQHPVIGQLSITDEDDNKESMADNEEHDDRILANNNVEAEIGNVLPIASDQEDAEDTRMTVDNDERSNEGQEQGDLSIASDEAILEPQPETIIPPEEEPSSSSSSAESLQAEPEEEESPSQSQSETFHAEELEHEKKGFEHEEKEVGEDNDDAPEQNDDEMYTNLDMPIDDASASAPTHPDMSSKYEQFQTMFNQLKTFQENCYTSEEEVSSDACGWDAFTRLVDDLRDLLSARGVAVLPPP